ncbi:hypothetical protein SARC_08006 [Sphaeroforma arctica JP610]|uniref:Serine aminopeptidase S33 domain-containing protein n=1 Tax=Sphaeroforma arctica JP610 TaxID=667725 RepID=A0A0L0FS42_9EUKA|nr:hypothetical protein SARC_08006 [Sphaeroforma arctica JP610]KNC79607.1 hypothetical protein SARC_08006 [Sphaeroforma arctica JP610]|eukprot:XP_014153509.1 hypothetical protein SARC_08006 [Sphaeroforma arctica JP610]
MPSNAHMQLLDRILQSINTGRMHGSGGPRGHFDAPSDAQAHAHAQTQTQTPTQTPPQPEGCFCEPPPGLHPSERKPKTRLQFHIPMFVWNWPVLRAVPRLLTHMLGPFVLPFMSAGVVVWARRLTKRLIGDAPATAANVVHEAYVPSSASGSFLGLVALAGACVAMAMLIFRDEVMWRSFGRGTNHVQPGFYYSNTPRNNRIAAGVDEHYNPTWWLFTGTHATLYPFLTYTIEEVRYKRMWVWNPVDGEKVGLDIAFPSDKGFQPDRPVLLVLHGLNGGSKELYCMDLVKRACAQGYTCVVMIARGLMQTPLTSANLFNGTRTSDLRATIVALKDVLPSDTKMVGCGFSMGAIILNNYLTRCGDDAGLEAAVSLSGGFDSVKNSLYDASRKVWQPFLVYALKKNFITENLDHPGFQEIDLHRAHRARDVIEFDTALSAPLAGFPTLEDYYREMSGNYDDRMDQIRIPLLALHAVDDPIVDVDSIPLAHTATNANLFFLVTMNGGHVGWPTGVRPNQSQFGFMSNVVLSFCHSALTCAHG